MWALRARAYVVATAIFGLFFGMFYSLLFFLSPASSFEPIPGLGDNPASSWLSWYVVLNVLLAFGVVLLQFWFSPRIVDWQSKVRYVTETEEPLLHEIVADLAARSGLPKPRVGVSALSEPNAFAFGRWPTDGRVCVTQPLLDTLPPEELKAVLAHEMSHLRHKDMIFMTLVQVVPLIAYIVARALLRRNVARGKGAVYVVIVGLIAFLIYLISTLLVLYFSRLREVYADQGCVELTRAKAPLASALFRITMGTANEDPDTVKEVGGTRALLITDPFRARKDAASFRWADVVTHGEITEEGLQKFDRELPRIPWHLRLAEILSTHPLLEHRLKLLAEMPLAPTFELVQANLRSTRPLPDPGVLR